MEDIVNCLSSGKALVFDAVTDSLFRKERPLITEMERRTPPQFLHKYTVKKLRNIWRVDLDQYFSEDDSWASRLVPLNKVFPSLPDRKQMRPIIVQSPLIKLIEARFLPKLKQYANERMVKSQTGFVPSMGIQVNIERAIRRITMRTEGTRKRNVYGVFIDFSNAFNTIPHSLLFKKLREKNVMDADEIKYLEQLYNRYYIKIGDQKFRANCGVAQGSIISPFLFNIYLEDLATKLKEEADIDLDDVLMYADDILTLCTSIEQMKKAILIIEEWSKENGMILNKKKSGIVVFAPRSSTHIPLMRLERTMVTKVRKYKSKGLDVEKRIESVHLKWVPAVKDVLGIPVCERYKYLGTILTPKLSLDVQLKEIKRKAIFIQAKMFPYLKVASLEGRKDIFTTLIMPLFNATLALFNHEPSESNKNNLLRVQRGLFKSFTMM